MRLSLSLLKMILEDKKLPECYLSECSGCNKCKFNCDNKYEKIVGEESSLLKLL